MFEELLISVLFIIVLIILCIISNKETVLENVTDEYKKEVVTEAVIEENKIASAKELIKNAISKEIILKSTDITEDKYNELLDEVNKETNKK